MGRLERIIIVAGLVAGMMVGGLGCSVGGGLLKPNGEERASASNSKGSTVQTTGVIESVGATTTATSATTSGSVPVDNIEKSSGESIKTFERAIAEAHSKMNDSVCYGRLREYVEGDMKNGQDVVSWISLAEDSLDDSGYGYTARANMAKDLENAKALYFMSYEFQNADGMLLVHRILHDLDYWFVNKSDETQNKDYFGFAHVNDGVNAKFADMAVVKAVTKSDLWRKNHPEDKSPFDRGAKLDLTKVAVIEE